MRLHVCLHISTIIVDPARILFHKHNFNDHLDKIFATCMPRDIDVCVFGCLLNYINTEGSSVASSNVFTRLYYMYTYSIMSSFIYFPD